MLFFLYRFAYRHVFEYAWHARRRLFVGRIPSRSVTYLFERGGFAKRVVSVLPFVRSCGFSPVYDFVCLDTSFDIIFSRSPDTFRSALLVDTDNCQRADDFPLDLCSGII